MGIQKATVDPSDEDYFNRFNTKKWIKAAEEWVKQIDIVECYYCGNDCSIILD